jgi:nucleoid-associated protein YgaU
MAGEFSDTGALSALEAVAGKTTLSSGTTYLALLTAAPSDSDGIADLTEYGATGYSRQAVTWAAAALNGSSVPEIANSAAITFGPFTAGTGATITHCALVTAGTGTSGDVRMHWQLDTSRTPGTNDSLQFAISALKMTLD